MAFGVRCTHITPLREFLLAWNIPGFFACTQKSKRTKLTTWQQDNLTTWKHDNNLGYLCTTGAWIFGRNISVAGVVGCAERVLPPARCWYESRYLFSAWKWKNRAGVYPRTDTKRLKTFPLWLQAPFSLRTGVAELCSQDAFVSRMRNA